MKREQGAVLIFTFIIMATLTAFTVFFLHMTATQLKSSAYDLESSKAFWIAEGGIEQVLYKLKNDVPAGFRDDVSDDAGDPTIVSGSVGSGSYVVTLYRGEEGDPDENIFYLTSTGTFGVITRKITESFAVASVALTRAIHADGSIVDFDGSVGTVNGNISCHVQVKNYGGITINGTITDGLDKIEPEIDFDYYKALAQAASQYFTSNLTFQNATYTGVWYTTKKATIGNNTVINGSIFAEGNIEFVNKADNVTISPSNNYPALATDSNMNSTDSDPVSQRVGLQNSAINGLVFADNNITFNYLKNTIFNGTMLANNNIYIQSGNNFTINYNAAIFSPMPPGFTYESGDVTAISQKDWNEVVPAS